MSSYAANPAQEMQIRLIERPVSGHEWTGEDRHRFLGGLVTCDVAGLEPGSGAYGFVTEIKGHVMADITVLALEDRLWIELPVARSEAIQAHAAKYRIVDRVDFAPLSAAAVTVVGPSVDAWLGIELEDPPWSHAAVEIGGVAVRAVRDPRFGPDGRTLWAAPETLSILFERLVQRGGLVPTAEDLEVDRVERAWPRFGVDYDEAHFPQETGLGDLTVSYTKGCYLGQEIVARIHYRGGVNRSLCGLRLSGDWTVGSALAAEGRPVGILTSAVSSSRFGPIGLAIVHRRGAEPGTILDVGDGAGQAEVTPLPFGFTDPLRLPD